MTLWNAYVMMGNFNHRIAVEAPDESSALEAVARELADSPYVIDQDEWDSKREELLDEGYIPAMTDTIMDETYIPVDGGRYLEIGAITISRAGDTDASGAVDPVKLAYDLADFSYDLDTYEFNDRYDSIEEAVQDNLGLLRTADGTGGIMNFLTENLDEGFADDSQEAAARDLIARLQAHLATFGSGSRRPRAKPKASSRSVGSKPKAKPSAVVKPMPRATAKPAKPKSKGARR